MAHRSPSWNSPRRASTRDRDRYSRATNAHAIKRARQRSELSAREILAAIREGRALHVGFGKHGNEIYQVLQGDGLPPVYGVYSPSKRRLVTVLTDRHISRRFHIQLIDKDTA